MKIDPLVVFAEKSGTADNEIGLFASPMTPVPTVIALSVSGVNTKLCDNVSVVADAVKTVNVPLFSLEIAFEIKITLPAANPRLVQVGSGVVFDAVVLVIVKLSPPVPCANVTPP